MDALDLYQAPPSMQDFQTKARAAASKLLQREYLCSIASIQSQKVPYIHTAYFVWSERSGCLFFLSDVSTQHATNIHSTPTVAINIFRQTKKWGSKIAGIQMNGKCKILDKLASENHLEEYAQKFPEAKNFLEDGLAGDFSNSRMFQVYTHIIKVVDEEMFGGEIYIELRRSSWHHGN